MIKKTLLLFSLTVLAVGLVSPTPTPALEKQILRSQRFAYDGQLDNAIAVLNNYLEHNNGKLNRDDRLKLHLKRAEYYLYKGSLNHSGYQKVTDILDAIEKETSHSGNKRIQAEFIHQRAMVAYFNGMNAGTELDKPRDMFKKELKLRQAAKDKRGEADALFYIGCCFQNKNKATAQDFDRAFDYFSTSYELAAQGGFMRVKCFASRHLAYIYYRKRNLDKALSYALESLKDRETIGLKIFLSPQYLAVGMTYYAQKDLDSALKYTRRAVDNSAAMGFKPVQVQALMFLGDLLKIKNETEPAANAYLKALNLAKTINLTEALPRIRKKLELLRQPTR